LYFISANEKSGTPGRASSKRKCPRKVKKPAIYIPVPFSVSKIRFCPSAVNDSAPIHQNYKKTISFLYKKPPRLPVTETGAVHLRYGFLFALFKRSHDHLRGFLIAA